MPASWQSAAYLASAWIAVATGCAAGAPLSFEELDSKADRDLEACLRQAQDATPEMRDTILDACMRERDWVRVRRD